MKYTKDVFGNSKEILFNDHYVGMRAMVSDAGVTADADGRKIVKAGTILPVNDATAEGVLLCDTDVTYGERPSTVIYQGAVVTAKLPVAPTEEAKAKLSQILFK